MGKIKIAVLMFGCLLLALSTNSSIQVATGRTTALGRTTGIKEVAPPSGSRTVSSVAILDPGSSYDIFLEQIFSFRAEVTTTGTGDSDYDIHFQVNDGAWADMPTSGALDLVAEGPPVNPAVNWKVDQTTKVHRRMVRAAQALTYTIRARVVDHNNSETVTLSATETVTATAYGGSITLPLPILNYMDVRFPDNLSGSTTSVSSALQTALNDAACGDTLELVAGTIFTGNFVLQRNECGCATDATKWIMIRSDTADSNLPDEDVRFDPAVHGAFVPTIRSTGSQEAIGSDTASTAANTVDCYYFFGVKFECTVTGASENFWCVRLGETTSTFNSPEYLIFDRTWFRADDQKDVRRGLFIENADRIAVINTYFEGWQHSGADAQSILIKHGEVLYFENNLLDGAAEPILFGGIVGPPDKFPEDILILRNNMTHPNEWNPEHPDYDGRSRTIKNLLEFKNGRRFIVEGNVLNNNWAGGQEGQTIILTPRNQGGCTWCTVHDGVIRYNKMFDVGRGFNVGARDNVALTEDTHNLWIHDNLLFKVGIDPFDGGNQAILVASTTSDSTDVRFTHNTFSKTLGSGSFDAQSNCDFDLNFYEYTDNLNDVNGSTAIGSGVAPGQPTYDACYDVNSIFLNNGVVNINKTEICDGGSAGDHYPTDHICVTGSAAVQFTDRTNDDYSLQGTSPYKSGATDGKDVGADIAKVLNKTSGVQ